MKVAVLRDPIFREHNNGEGHPERPARLDAVDRALERSSIADALVDLPPRDATEAQLARVHDRDYIRRIAATDGSGFRMLDADTGVGPRSYRAALRAAGAAVTAVEAVVAGEVRRAFALPRPPGHHAERDRAMGFCLFNNVAVAAAHARAILGVERVAIVDWDVHHGNGTQRRFYDDPAVLYVSVHQHPLFPGTGLLEETGGNGAGGRTINLPLPAGRTDRDYRIVFEQVILPVLGEFSPELLLVSAGFDAHRNDPLAGMSLSSEAFRRMTRELLRVAEEHAEGRIVHVLEGGYDPAALSEGVELVFGELTADRLPEREPALSPDSAREGLEKVLSKARRLLPRYWASVA